MRLNKAFWQKEFPTTIPMVEKERKIMAICDKVRRIKKVSELIKIAKEAPYSDVSIAAINSINKLSVLTDIEKNDLIDIALNDTSFSVRKTALLHISDDAIKNSILDKFLKDCETRGHAWVRVKENNRRVDGVDGGIKKTEEFKCLYCDKTNKEERFLPWATAP